MRSLYSYIISPIRIGSDAGQDRLQRKDLLIVLAKTDLKSKGIQYSWSKRRSGRGLESYNCVRKTWIFKSADRSKSCINILRPWWQVQKAMRNPIGQDNFRLEYESPLPPCFFNSSYVSSTFNDVIFIIRNVSDFSFIPALVFLFNSYYLYLEGWRLFKTVVGCRRTYNV